MIKLRCYPSNIFFSSKNIQNSHYFEIHKKSLFTTVTLCATEGAKIDAFRETIIFVSVSQHFLLPSLLYPPQPLVTSVLLSLKLNQIFSFHEGVRTWIPSVLAHFT
jgi:hypothetical protein